ncbi:hypothetical protein CDD82_3226 [Ophiocordyceps australis]|uniref:UNC-45/Cro1/She4 central domain-containing protein n=1 Tax=Ophiocordyceps australis TaxID=1399860 RepID=A0A2C5Y5M4_9HYPO|nr:hypothetical protein CDD82_3226 [Ophiocordyceps australis]
MMATAQSLEDQTLLAFAQLMEGGQEDDETCRELDALTKLLNDDYNASQANPQHQSICRVIDGDCVDTVLGYLDMRQPDAVRAHATLATSAYLKAAGQDGSKKLSAFFFDRVRRGTYDDYIVAFCVASAIFPVVPELSATLFLSEGFLGSLGPLMRREWKSRKVETACLEMLNTACMNPLCRDAVQKYCVDWLEEVVDQHPQGSGAASDAEPKVQGEGGSISMRRHSEQVQHLAAVILAKLRAVPSKPPHDGQPRPRVEPAVTSIQDLSAIFTKMILRDQDHGTQHSVEGLAYASLQPSVKESIIADTRLLHKLVKTLTLAPPRSPTTYGALSIFLNLTRYRPRLTDEETKMNQLKAYANATDGLPYLDPLDDDEHVCVRCQAVFDAGLVPVLVTHSKNGSPASLSLIVSIIHALAVTKSLRAPLAQQGAVKLLLAAWAMIPSTDEPSRRMAAQALARILISTNPALVFGGNRPTPINAAIRPLGSIVAPHATAETRDLLPTFEALMALTNLASLDDEETRRSIIKLCWPDVEEQVMSSNQLVAKAAVELVCNLVQAPEGVALYADATPQASTRIHILLALADADDTGIRSAAGGALASLTGYEPVLRSIVQRDRGVDIILGLCSDPDQGLRHRGVVALYNMVAADGEAGNLARDKVKRQGGVDVLKDCLKQSHNPDVVQTAAEALKALLAEQTS